MTKTKWVTQSVARRYIRRYGGSLHLCRINPYWLILKTRDTQFKCYVAG